MQESRKNVVHMSQYGRSRTPTGSNGSGLASGCGELAAERLAAALSKALQRVADDLLELADRVTGLEMRRLYAEATAFARDRAGTLEADFRKLYFQRYLRVCRRERIASGKPASEISLDQIGLVESDELEESLATSTIANAINNVCGEEMFGLAKRVGAMLDDPDLELGDNPLSPEIVAEVIMDLMRAHDLAIKARLALVPQLNKYFPKPVRGVYQELNRHLIEQGVLPSIRVSYRKAAPHEAPLHGQHPAADSHAVESYAPGGERDLLSVLQQLLAAKPSGAMPAGGYPGYHPGGSQGGELSMPSGGLSVPIGPAPIFVQTLTQLQHGQHEAWSNLGLATPDTGDGQVNVLHALRGVASSLPQVDAMTLDIVAMVFDYILDDQRIPDAMKALIGRLQIPVLKVAMLDRSFFSQKAHAARQLLDALAEASMGWDEQEGHDGGLYRKIDEIVQRILNEFEDRIDIFVMALEDLRAYQAEEQRRINELTSRSATLVQQREEVEIAAIVAHDEVRSQLFDETLPGVIHEFLHGPWEQHLTDLYRLQGEDSLAWKAALTTMGSLIWSVKPKLSAEERKQLVRLLPDLLSQIETGLRNLEGMEETRDRFFTALVKCHAEAVRAGLQSNTPPTPSAPEDNLVLTPEAPPVASTAAINDSEIDDFEAIPELDQVVEPDTTILAELSAPPAVPERAPLSLAEGSTESRLAPEDLVGQLRRGTWIEFDQDDGSACLAKLAWISPHRGVYLFTNRLGQRAMSITPDGLTSKFRDGTVRLVDAMPLLDRAMNSLMERLSGVGS